MDKEKNEDTNITDQDIIFATANPSSYPSAISIMRISGRGCLCVLSKCIKKPQTFIDRPNYLGLVQLIEPRGKVLIDKPMFVFFQSPRSYTGEEAAEIHLHGGDFIVQKLISILTYLGFRYAYAGEFTRRAYLNGKMDLTEAEGVHEMIHASSHQQWLAASQLFSGKLKSCIDGLREQAIKSLSRLEAAMDFPDEEEVSHIEAKIINSEMVSLKVKIERLIRSYQSGRVSSKGLKVVVIGAPNAGKSTLMNYLLKKERAIVTDIPGTTRDYLEENILIQGRLISLVDTAGIRSTNDIVEQAGVEKAISLSEEADLVLCLKSSQAGNEDSYLIDKVTLSTRQQVVVKVLTKVDLLSKKERQQDPSIGFSISCVTGDGLKNLEDFLVSQVDGYVESISEQPFISSSRHLAALENALFDIDSFFTNQSKGLYEEILASNIRSCTQQLEEIIGKVYVEDILDRVFSDFCIGK